MNSELNQIMLQAEGRFLSSQEKDSFLQYVRGMPERLGRARTLQQKEAELADTAATALLEGQNHLVDVPGSRDRFVEDFKQHLRYVGQAHVNDDMTWFEDQYADWMTEEFTATMDASVVISGFEGLLQAMREQLDPADFRAVSQFSQRFIELLRNYQ